MTYNLISSTGTITLPPKTTMTYKGIDIFGRDTKDWNLPLQQTAVTLVDMVSDKLEASTVGVSVQGYDANTVVDANYETRISAVESAIENLDATYATDAEVAEIGSFADFEAAFDANK